VEEWGWG